VLIFDGLLQKNIYYWGNFKFWGFCSPQAIS
jgi:hypothetical protein